MEPNELASRPELAVALAVTRRVFERDASKVEHAIRVATTVLSAGGTTDQVQAALLHDVVEDLGIHLWPAINEFGTTVTGIVKDCSDCEPTRGETKAPWVERKVAHVNHLRMGAAPETYLVVAADKLDALQRTVSELREDSHDYWSKKHFKGGCFGTLWYYRAMSANLSRHIPDNPISVAVAAKIRELGALVDALESSDTASLTDDELLEVAKRTPFPKGIRPGDGGIGTGA